MIQEWEKGKGRRRRKRKTERGNKNMKSINKSMKQIKVESD